ncbi:Mitochondrial distribution/morphology family 35/apoptosis [Cinnamomum micranthum f. kanehirae]|uniref:Mitochondrial distribution/morphology family 35/apoptosis n=1 Tax=Cinnamomum micranthum f. kanehirae TaxID=337451 RepID=A0A3S5WGM0_9MAGN|nr:Mitochondrial distribution/morphology family 35/apoptosis [Cinnamomum micranthum f. kanehirae]
MGIKKRNTAATGTTSPCANLRASYHECFNKWYAEKFSKGQWDKEECISEWEKYRACLMQHLDDKHLSRLLEDNSDLPADADSSSL